MFVCTLPHVASLYGASKQEYHQKSDISFYNAFQLSLSFAFCFSGTKCYAVYSAFCVQSLRSFNSVLTSFSPLNFHFSKGYVQRHCP